MDPTRTYAERVEAIAARFGVARADVEPVALQGQVNRTLFLGSELVLRLPRDPRAEQKLAWEAAVIPAVREAGVPTPAIVAYDTTRTIVDIPYLVQERSVPPICCGGCASRASSGARRLPGRRTGSPGSTPTARLPRGPSSRTATSCRRT